MKVMSENVDKIGSQCKSWQSLIDFMKKWVNIFYPDTTENFRK